MATPHRVEIEYCTRCRWLLRASWMATFERDLGEVALVPGTGGVLGVRVDGAIVWSRMAEGRPPEPSELEQRVRDVVAPGLSPSKEGHADR